MVSSLKSVEAVDNVDTKVIATKPATKKQVLKRLIKVAGPETGRIILGLAALIVNAITNLSFPTIMQNAVDQTFGVESTARLSLDNLSISSVAEFLTQNIFFVKAFGIFAVGSAASWARVYCLGSAKETITASLRKALFDSYMDKDKEFFDCGNKGDLLVAMNSDASTAADTITDTFASGLRSLNSAINGSISLYLACPSLFGVTISIIPIIGVAGMKMSKFSRGVTNKLRAKQADMMSFAVERIDSITTVRLNGKEEEEKTAYHEHLGDCGKLINSAQLASGAFMAFTNVATNLSLVSVLYFGGRLIKFGTLSAGALTAFAMKSALVGMGFSGLSNFYSDTVKGIDAARRVFALIDENSSSGANQTNSAVPSTPTTPAPLPRDDLSSKLGKDTLSEGDEDIVFHGITFTDVCFQYKSRPDHVVLNHLNLSIAPNSLTAIAGKSGSGKSTIMSILAGLHRPSSGLVTVQGVDICKASRSWLRRQVGVVEQSANLLSGTIAYNIGYGKPNATQAEIQAAAVAAEAFDFISAFPDGFNTQVGVGGKLLSGGQQARIALARALIKDPACLLLDEATGTLDRDTEMEIIHTLLKLSRAKVIVAFTHSEVLMKAATVVRVIDKTGGCGSSGPFTQLLSQGTLGGMLN